MRSNSIEFSFTDFVDQFLYTMVCLLHGDVDPRIGEDIQKILHLSDQIKIEDWYLYQTYTENQIYECEMPPYKLPKLVPMRLFSLEYI